MNDPYWEPENEERDERFQDSLPRSSRPLREEFLGCLGIACTLFVAPLLWFAFDPSTFLVQRFIPLVMFVAIAVGVALMMRVPSGAQRRSRDPYRPLTRSGASPVIERPATLSARLSFALGLALTALALAAYVIAALDRAGQQNWALPVALLAGLALLAHGGLVIVGRFSPPAIHWQRLAIAGGAPHRGWLLVSVGVVNVSATLLLAMLEGYMWGFIGLALLLMTLVTLLPFARHAPEPIWRSESSLREPKDVE
jgi:hypothetical protein